MIKRNLSALAGSIVLAQPTGAIELPSDKMLVVLNATGQGAYYQYANAPASSIAAGCLLSVDVSAASSALGGSIESFAAIGRTLGTGLQYNYDEFLYVDVDGGLLYANDSSLYTTNVHLINGVQLLENYLQNANLGLNVEGSYGDFDSSAPNVPFLQASSVNLIQDQYTLTGAIASQVVSPGYVELSGTTLSIGHFSFPVCTSSPDVSISSPIFGASIAVGQSITVTVNATDDVSVSHCELTVNGSYAGQDASSPYEFSGPLLSSLALGSYALEATCTDNAGQSTTVPSLFTVDTDTDGDLITDTIDNCVAISNANQQDLDNDGQGDACDGDIDGDGFSNQVEAKFGGNPQDGSDASTTSANLTVFVQNGVADSDFDGVPDAIEAVAGTDSNDGSDAQNALDTILGGFSKAVPAIGLPGVLVMFTMMLGIAMMPRPKNKKRKD